MRKKNVIRKEKMCYECPRLRVEGIYLEDAFMVSLHDNYQRRDDDLHKIVSKSVSSHYDPPSLCVQEVLLEVGFLRGSHESYKVDKGYHEEFSEEETDYTGNYSITMP